MKLGIIFCIILKVLAQLNFTEFQNQYNSTYKSDQQKSYRQQIFQQNLKYIAYVNSLNLPYTLKINQYSDKTQQQMNQITRNPPPKILKPSTQKVKANIPIRRLSKVPSVLDWRTKGGVSPVKNQRTCSSCWAFTTVALAQSFLMIKTGNVYNLSEQYVLQCTPNASCQGGQLIDALNTIQSSNGLPSQSSYPYTGYYYPNKPGHSLSTPGICTLSSMVSLPNNTIVKRYNNLTNEDIKILLQLTPVMAYMKINPDFHYYGGGIFECPGVITRQQLNFHTEIIGYNSDRQTWIIKVSLGGSWGVDGFAQINMNMNCGLTFDVYQFQIQKNEKNEIWKYGLILILMILLGIF